MPHFPWQSIALNPLAAFGILLTLGVIGGHIANRMARLPAMTGYALIGLIIGPASLHILNEELLRAADLFVNLALGLALFESGRRVDLRWLRAERTLLLSTLAYCLLVFAALYTLLCYAGLNWQTSTTMAAIGMATSPIVILELMREERAEGQVSDRLATATALSSLLSLLAFAVSLGSAHLLQQHRTTDNLLTPAWLILGSSLLGLLAGVLAIALKRWLGHQRQHRTVLLFGLITLLVGLAVMLDTLPSLALLVFGLATRNLRGGESISEPDLLTGSHFFFVAFFVAAGAWLQPQALASHWALALAYLLLRSGIAMLFWFALAPANCLTRRRGLWLGLALNPLSGGSAMLLSMGSLALGTQASSATACLMAVLVISELAGPWLCRLALQQAGKLSKEY
ncbi:cation:proton antiporter [Aquitalea sp. LB_tupeE]|uniref:cation:proton antiporter n=1 Tax=Aquitalea sp. LB_tupeE TaxID=2748078 RepID=UPI0015BE702B|nr:cation:proton antiporter [Aquitalea sp. LB_tupeE]NWK79952.1 cation:proton antiporter [Aquitalea sp. LB_tupeE]